MSWLTNHPHLAQALEQWRENTSGAEPDRHAQVKNGLASVRYPVELVAVREELRAGEELSNVAEFATGPSPHEDCLAEEIFIDDVRGGVLEAQRVNQGKREEV